ncbi:hypothetical protein M378DRAFT_15919, partial [Amanita muscaria Koide BX008]
SYDCKDDSPQFATIPSFPGTKDTPPNFAVDWNGQYRLGERDIYFTDNWRYREDRSLVEESHFYTDREPSDLPRVAVKFNREIYLCEREILYRPDAKVFTERGTGLVLTDNIWNIPKNVTKEDLLLHVPFDKKERLAHLIDQRNQQLSAERSKTQSPRNAPALSDPQNRIQDPHLKNQLLQDLVKSKDRDPEKPNHPRNHEHHQDNNLPNQEEKPLYHEEHPLHQEIHQTIHSQWQPPQITLLNSPSPHQRPSLEKKPEHIPGSPNAKHISCNPVFV